MKKFDFKQFSIQQDKCAMKVGTDGVLLGAWTPLHNNPYSVLDIGAGTGLISLMIAQRSHAEQIDAVEIDENAYEECVENFENSPWNDRLFCYHASLNEFTEEMQDEVDYDLIVSNPPFYSENYKSEITTRDLARFQDAMPFEELIKSTCHLLSDIGVFATIIPYKEEKAFLNIAGENQLFPFKITRMKGTATSEIKRSLIAFSKSKQNLLEDELIIEITRHNYTPEYTELTKDFYLKM